MPSSPATGKRLKPVAAPADYAVAPAGADGATLGAPRAVLKPRPGETILIRGAAGGVEHDTDRGHRAHGG